MGVMVVLVVYAVALIIAASMASIDLGGVAHGLTKHSVTNRKRATLASA